MKLSTLLQEQRELKIHSESALCLSELAEAVPAEREAILFEERVWKFFLRRSLYSLLNNVLKVNYEKAYFYSILAMFPCSIYTNKIDTSAGFTPDMRDACPTDNGRTFFNFSFASVAIPPIAS